MKKMGKYTCFNYLLHFNSQVERNRSGHKDCVWKWPKGSTLSTWYFLHLWRSDFLSTVSQSALVLSLEQNPQTETLRAKTDEQCAWIMMLASCPGAPLGKQHLVGNPVHHREIFCRGGKKRNSNLLQIASTLNADLTVTHFHLWIRGREKKQKRERLKRKRDNNKEWYNIKHWLTDSRCCTPETNTTL